jgi:hypothetical protein
MTVRDNIDSFPTAVFEDDAESNKGEEMVAELEEDTLKKPTAHVKTLASDPAEFEFNQKPEGEAEGSEHSEENPFHYAKNKGGVEKLKRKSSFAGTGFEKLASSEQEEEDLDDFFTSEKLFMILSNAGKPVYSS